jgi:hypothetical protein
MISILIAQLTSFPEFSAIRNINSPLTLNYMRRQSMKKFLMVGAVLVTCITLSGPAFAAGFGGAGCGPGSLVAGTAPGAMQLLGVTINVTFSPTQYSAITTGFSNCNPQGLVKLEQERELFAQTNYSSLVREMAEGEGENLSTLAGMYGCSVESHGEFNSMVQENFEHIVQSENTTSSQMLASLENEMAGHEVLSKSCSGMFG